MVSIETQPGIRKSPEMSTVVKMVQTEPSGTFDLQTLERLKDILIPQAGDIETA
jgi:hypothetical protein